MQTHTAVTHHRVDLVEGFATPLDVGGADVKLVCQLLFLVLGLRHELVERRVEQTEGHVLAVHNLHCALYCGLHERFEL